MDAAKFERAILEMVYEGGVQRLTAAGVAYHLDIPFREAEEGLERLLKDGVVELDSDDDGNLFYEIPNASPRDVPPRPTREASRPSQAVPHVTPGGTTTGGVWASEPEPVRLGSRTSSTWGPAVEPNAYKKNALTVPPEVLRRRAFSHALASLLVPGVGQIFQGRMITGLLFLFFGVFTLPAVPVMIFLHLWSAADAYKHVAPRGLLE